MLRIKPIYARFSCVTVQEREQGFCVKAVRKPVGCLLFRSVWKSLSGNRSSGQDIRTIIEWSSSQNNNNNAWNQNFNNGNQNNNNKNNTNSVRAIRGFTQKQKRRNAFFWLARINNYFGQVFFRISYAA